MFGGDGGAGLIIEKVDDPSVLSDRIARHLKIDLAEQQALLECVSPIERLEKILRYLEARGRRAGFAGARELERARDRPGHALCPASHGRWTRPRFAAGYRRAKPGCGYEHLVNRTLGTTIFSPLNTAL